MINSLAVWQRGIEVLDAIWITLGGMAIVFATLAILMLVMIGLCKWLKPKEEEKEKG